MIELLKSIPASYRRVIYATYVVAVFLVGGVQVGFATAGASQPQAIDIIIAVLVYVGGALGFSAAVNAGNAGPPPVPEDNADGPIVPGEVL